MSSFANPTNGASYPGHPTAPPKRNTSAATLDKTEEYGEGNISPDSGSQNVEPQTISASNNRLLAPLGGPFETRKETILQRIANVPTSTEKLAALPKDVTAPRTPDNETAIEIDLDIAKSHLSVVTNARSLFETHHEDMLIDLAMVKAIRDNYIEKENRSNANIQSLEYQLMVARHNRATLERKRQAEVEQLYQDNVEYWEILGKLVALGPDGMSPLRSILSQQNVVLTGAIDEAARVSQTLRTHLEEAEQ